MSGDEGLTKGQCVQCYRRTVCAVFVFDNLLIDYANGMLENRCIAGGKDIFHSVSIGTYFDGGSCSVSCQPGTRM